MLIYMYGSKRTGRRGGSKRRYTSKKGQSTYKKVKNLDKKVKKIEKDIELKFDNSVVTNAAIGSVWTNAIFFNDIAQGTTARTRVGNEIRMTSIRIRGAVYQDALPPTGTKVRCILFWDKFANGAAPPIASGTAGLIYAIGSGSEVNWPINYDQSERFKVLLDREIVLNPMTTDSIGAIVPAVKDFSFKIKLGRMVKYFGSGNTIADISSNSLCMTFCAQDYDSATYPTTSGARVDFSWQIFFKDA